MMRFISCFLTLVILFARFPLPAQATASPCGEAYQIYLPILTMAQPTILENLEEIMRADAAFPYDAVITQVFTNTVNVKPVGSRTIIRDVALPEHIKADDLEVGYPVRLGNSGSKVTVLAYFEQFADPESVNYAGKGMKMPGKPTVAVRATAGGWVITWPAVPNATRYLVYTNNTPDGDAPELLATLPSSTLTYTATYNAIEEPFRYFAVQACNGLLEGDVSGWVTDETPPLNPAWISDTFQADGHHLKWSHAAPSDVEEYIIFRNTSASDVGAVEIGRTKKLELIAPYDSSGDYFGVQAVDYSGLNKSPIVWSSLYDPTPTSAPATVADMAEFGGFVVHWPAVVNSYRYEVESATDGSGTNATEEWNGSTLYTPTIMKSGVAYFRARAIGFDLSGGPWSGWVTDANAPPKPVLATSGGIQSVYISLDTTDPSHNSIGFSHYKLERADSDTGTNATILDNKALYSSFPRSYSQTLGITKYFRLTPYDWAGNVGTPSDWTAATPSTADATVQDKFDTYGGTALTPLESLYWLEIAKGDSAETGWFFNVGITKSTNYISEGDRSLRLLGDQPPPVATYARPMDLSQEGRFGNDDYVVLYTTLVNYGSNPQFLDFFFYKQSGVHQKGTSFVVLNGEVGGELKRKKSELTGLGTMGWNEVQGIHVAAQDAYIMGGPSLEVYVDSMRISKADPDDPSDYNDTGRAWDKAVSTGTDKGAWHIYPGNRMGEPKKPFSYGQIAVPWPGGSPDRWYLSHKPLGLDIKTGTIQSGIFHKENGKGGLAFFVKNVAPDQWTMYAIETDNVADTIKLVKWVDGVRTELGSANFPFISAGGGTVGQTIWVGADFSEYDVNGGRIKVYASTTEGNLIQAGNLKISLQDTEVGSGGTVGMLSFQSNMRFVNFVAGSPAHAEVADVAKALDGPIVGGENRRVHYNSDLNRWEYTDDGINFYPLSGSAGASLVSPLMGVTAIAVAELEGGADQEIEVYKPINSGSDIYAPNLLYRTSAARPGVTRLYRRDSDANHSVQTHWDGSRWWLRGYGAADVFHAECRVAYADAASNATTVNNFTAAKLKANGSVVYRTSSVAGLNGLYTIVWSAYYSGHNDANMWDGSTALYAQRTGWHYVFAGVNLTSQVATDNLVLLLALNGTTLLQHNDRRSSSQQACGMAISGCFYMSAGSYFQAKTGGSTNYTLDISNFGAYFGLVSLESAT